MPPAPQTLIVAITGASGARYAQRFLQSLVAAKINTHLIVSPLGRRLLHDELGMESVDLPALAGSPTHTITLHNYNDVGSTLASGSFLHDGMVIVPCSSNTLAEVAHGLGDNLISRAAAVTLKERRRLILVHREMPLSPIDINNYKTLSDAGVILASANPGFYLNPTTVEEVIEFVAGKLLDLVGVPHALDTRWDPKNLRPPAKERDLVQNTDDMVKLQRKIDQWLLIGKGIELSPTDIDSSGARLIARGRTLGGPDDGAPFDRAIELAIGQSAHFGPHVAVTLLEVRGQSAKFGILAPSNVAVLAKEQSENDARNDRP